MLKLDNYTVFNRDRLSMIVLLTIKLYWSKTEIVLDYEVCFIPLCLDLGLE